MLPFADLRFADPYICCDLRLRNEHKNMLISDLRTNRKDLRAHLCWVIHMSILSTRTCQICFGIFNAPANPVQTKM
jgi:hypothetical protein